MIIPAEYFKEEKIVKLTQLEIDKIIEELQRVPHNVFEFEGYDKIINKLKTKEEIYKTT